MNTINQIFFPKNKSKVEGHTRQAPQKTKQLNKVE
jgi:hypothetical protein